MRAYGQGFSRLENFTSLMNIPKPITKNNYNKLIITASESAKILAKELLMLSMKSLSLLQVLLIPQCRFMVAGNDVDSLH